MPPPQYSDAVDARNAADLSRAAYEKSHRARPRNKQLNDAERAADDDAFAPVATAYRQAIDRFPGTEIECQCRLRLAGAYQYRGQFDVALVEAKQAAERFLGTRPGMEATQAVALIYLQALHDKAQAEIWFHRLNADAGTLKDDSDRLKWQVAAAQGLARCKLEK